MSYIRGVLHIHFIGIGGISMSALAKLMLIWGHKVSGSDVAYHKTVEELVEWGASVYVGSDLKVINDADLIVYTPAIKEDDIELLEARKQSKKIMSREHFLRELSFEFGSTIAVSGTHGKTTVTSMLSEIFFEADFNYTAHIGGYSQRGNLVYRGKDYFITEACEYNRSFLSLMPDIGLILNVEFDHPDTYKNLKEVNQAFCSFAHNIKRGGTLVVNKDTAFYDIIKCTYKNMCTYSTKSTATFTATNIIDYANGYYGFQIVEQGYPNIDIKLKVAGMHNVSNALGAYACAVSCGVDRQDARRSLENFLGVRGRMEQVGTVGGARVICDYAHHPTEIATTIGAVRKSLAGGKLRVLFQPHTMLRTEALMDEFTRSFQEADEVYILKEYLARKEDGGKSAYDFYLSLQQRQTSYYFSSALEMYSNLMDKLTIGDIVLILGAGDIRESYSILLN